MKFAIIFSSAIALLYLRTLDAQEAPSKIAIINGQTALVGTQQGKKALDQWKAKVENKQKEFEVRGNEITQLEEQLNKGGAVITADRKEQLAASISDKKKRLQRDLQDAQEETQRDQEQSFQPIDVRLKTVIDKYAADKGYALVVDVSVPGNPVRYFHSGSDITREIVTLYDKTYAAKP